MLNEASITITRCSGSRAGPAGERPRPAARRRPALPTAGSSVRTASKMSCSIRMRREFLRLPRAETAWRPSGSRGRSADATDESGSGWPRAPVPTRATDWQSRRPAGRSRRDAGRDGKSGHVSVLPALHPPRQEGPQGDVERPVGPNEACNPSASRRNAPHLRAEIPRIPR